MAIRFYNEDTPKFSFNKVKAKGDIIRIIETEGKQAKTISVIFCSDTYLLNINQQFLNHRYYTDIITFNYCEKDKISGDIFISIERVKENSIKFDTAFENELNRVLFHGVLHLLGFDDKTGQEQRIMREKENYYLNLLKI